MKKCTNCLIFQSLDCFNKNKRKKDGLQNYCRVCTRKNNNLSYVASKKRRNSIYQRNKKNRENNKRFLSRYKSFFGCIICKEKDSCAIDLHHLNPEIKDRDTSNMVNESRKLLKKEIRKCVLLCANCHRKVHAGKITLL